MLTKPTLREKDVLDRSIERVLMEERRVEGVLCGLDQRDHSQGSSCLAQLSGGAAAGLLSWTNA